LTLIGNVSVKSSLPVRGVAHNLESSIWKSHTVLAPNNFPVANGVVRIVCAVIIVLNCVVEILRHARYMVIVEMFITQDLQNHNPVI
jgi:hypothetical protein